MHITKLTLESFKGVSRAFDMGRLTLLMGPNGSGKTALLEAIRFAIRGSTSAGGRADDTMLLMGPLGGSVSVELSDGFAWTRGLRKDPRSKSVKQAIVIRGREGDGLKESHAAIVEHCGDYAPMFNLAEFTGLSPDKRRDAVLDLCGRQAAHTMEPAAITGQIAQEWLGIAMGDELARVHLQGNQSPLVVAREQLGALRAECLERGLEAIRGDLTAGEDVSASVAGALETAKRLASEARGSADGGRAAAAKLSERKASLAVVAESVDALQHELGSLRAQKEEYAEALGNATGRQASIRDAELRIATLDMLIAEWKERVHALNNEAQRDLRDDPATLVARADVLEEVSAPDTTLRDKALTSVQVTRRNLEAALKERADMQSRIQSARRSIETAEREIATLEGTDASAAYLLFRQCSQILAALAGVAFPGALDKPWMELGNILRELSSEPTKQSFREIIREANAEIARLESAGTGDVDALEALLNDTINEHQDAERALIAARSQYDAAQAEAWRIRNEAQATIADRKERAAKLDNAKATMAEKEAERLRTEKELNALRADGGMANIEQLTQARMGIQTLIEQAEQRIRDREAYQVLDRELAKTIAAAERDEVMADVARDLSNAVRRVREGLMERLVAPLVQSMQRFIEYAVGFGAQVYCRLETDRGRPDFEIGWTRNDVRVPLPAMSGGETGVFCAALAYALVSLSDAPLKLLMIEAAEMDVASMDCMLDALAFCANDIGNVIIAHWDDNRDAPGSFSVICTREEDGAQC